MKYKPSLLTICFFACTSHRKCDNIAHVTSVDTKKLNSRRVVEVEYVRVGASIVIMLFHMGHLPSGHLAVEIFALLSGLLMARSFSKKRLSGTSEPPWRGMGAYVLRKVKAFYPELLIATALGLLCLNYTKLSMTESVNYISNTLINNVLLLKMFGVMDPAEGACAPVWYLSSMVLSMLIIYPLLRKIQPWVAFILGAGLFGYLLYCVGGVERHHYSEWVGFTYGGNIRVCSEMMMAVGVYPLIDKAKVWIGKSKQRYTFVKCCRYVALCGMLCLFFCESGKTDIIFVLMAITYLLGAFACTGMAKEAQQQNPHEITKYFGAASMVIYLTHYPAIRMGGWACVTFGIPMSCLFLCIVFVTFVFSLITYWGGRYLRARFSVLQQGS